MGCTFSYIMIHYLVTRKMAAAQMTEEHERREHCTQAHMDHVFVLIQVCIRTTQPGSDEEQALAHKHTLTDGLMSVMQFIHTHCGKIM